MKEENELIAKFMGKTIQPQVGTPEFVRWNGERCDYSYYEVAYHTSWDWLMPVVEKICKHVYDKETIDGVNFIFTAHLRTFGMFSEDGKYMVRFNRMSLHESENMIEATYHAVVEFIKWYNQQNK